MTRLGKDLFILALITTLSTLFVWLPFALGLRKGMLTVFANYDGPNYLIVAKTLYDKATIASSFSLPIPLEYYPAHLPAYPLLIKFFDLFLPGPWAMLLVTLSTTLLAIWMFYLLVKKFQLSLDPFWLAVLFLFLPARWLVVRSVGSPEPLFIFAILASIYFFKERHWWLAGIFGALAQITKTPGILLFAGYTLFLLLSYINALMHDKLGGGQEKLKRFPWQAYPLLLIPLAIVPVFWFYKIQTGDFLAYFHSGDNFHLVFPPFQSFIAERSWLGDFWLEDMVYIYLLGSLSVILLFKRKLYDLATFAFIFFLATLFIAHRDLSRYSLPLVPFALIAFAPFLEKKEFRIAFLIILIPLYLYALNFILHNTAPIADWTPYL